jgi:hypothetical protein
MNSALQEAEGEDTKFSLKAWSAASTQIHAGRQHNNPEI